MESMDSLTAFFYNVVPGFLFILAFDYLFDNKCLDLVFSFIGDKNIQDKRIVLTFLFISVGLFFGFVFQGLTKIIRQYSFKDLSKKILQIKPIRFVIWLFLPFDLNTKLWLKVVEKDEAEMEKAFEYVEEWKLFKGKKIEKWEDLKKDNNKLELKRFFYAIHNYLIAKNLDKQATFYTSRLAFWFNIYFGTFFLFFIALIFQKKIPESIGLGILLLFSRWLSAEYLRCMYDVILKTFVSTGENKNKK